jgi:hypothetical protein
MSTEPVEIINVQDFQMYEPQKQDTLEVSPFTEVSDLIAEPCDGSCGTEDCQGTVDFSTPEGMRLAVGNVVDFVTNAMEHHASLDVVSDEARDVRDHIHAALQRIHPAVLIGVLCTFADTAVRACTELHDLRGGES